VNLLEIGSPMGGSLNTTDYDESRGLVVKRYDGPIPRGHDKLYAEAMYLDELPPHAAAHFNRRVSFAHRVGQPPTTTLELERHSLPAVAKALLSHQLTPSRTGQIVREMTRILLTDVYPVAQAIRPGREVFGTYHAARLSAVPALASVPALAPMCTARSLRVNGVSVPNLHQIATWLRAAGPKAFAGSHTLVRAHMDSHLDNVLASTDGAVRVIFVDPRGDLIGPAHYDFAKTLKSCRSVYHEIHYGLFDLDHTVSAGECRVGLHVSDAYAAHRREGLHALIGSLGDYAAAEGLSVAAFVRAALVAELVHVISFSWYHANRPEGINARRVRAYLALASLLARRLMTHVSDVESLKEPLVKGA
jgi:hypothetical protein